jgi:hypothetical protein
MTDVTPVQETKPMLSNQTYDLLKKLVTLALPAFGTLYVTIAALWGLPNPEAVAGTVLALGTFLGVLLNVAGRSYAVSKADFQEVDPVDTDGEIVVTENPDGSKSADLVLKNYENPADIVAQDRVTFSVRKA